MAVAVGVLVATTGCSELDEPASAGLTRTDLVADLAGQLDDASDLTYEATYQLLGGDIGTIAQQRDPARIGFVYPGGQLIVTTDSTTQCSTGKMPVTCTVTAHSGASSAAGASAGPGSAGAGGSGPGIAGPAPEATERVEDAGLISPATVQTMLNRAVPDPDVDVRQHDTTIAGRHATCIELIGLEGGGRDFEACVTTEGVLGSFTGTVGDKPIEVAMTHYTERISAATITPPADAHLTPAG